MKIDWRAELAQSEARVAKVERAIGDAKVHLKTLEKDLEKARKANRETLRAFIDGRQNLPLFDAAEEPAGAPAAKPEPEGLEIVLEGRDGPLAPAEHRELEDAVGGLLGGPVKLEYVGDEPDAPKPKKPRKTTAKLAGASKVPTATVEAPDEAERVGCGKPAPVAAEPDADDWSSLWSRTWEREVAFTIGGEVKTVDVGYRVTKYGGGEFVFSQPLQGAGYGTYGMGEVKAGFPQHVPAAWRKRPIEYGRLLCYHLCRLTAQAGLEPADAPDAPAWRLIPLDDLAAIDRDARETLRRCGAKTAGDVADAIDLQADDVRTDLDTEAVEIPDGPWRLVVEAVDTIRDPSGRTALARAEAAKASAAPAGPSETAIHEALKEALWPEGMEPTWRAKREEGMSDGEVLAELTRIWPRTYLHVEGPEGSPGWTVQGAGWPSFRLGGHVVGPNAGPVSKPLFGAELARAVRHVMRIPDSAEPTSAKAKAEKAKASRPRRKAEKV